MRKLNFNQSGFTFIEMLVTITIIAVLTAVGSTSFKVANQKARDGKRQGDLQQIRAALELYRTDLDQYPDSLPATGDNLEGDGVIYLGDMPGDPLDDYSYYYSSPTGSTYVLCAALELGKDTVVGCGDCGTGICNYKVESPL